MAEALIGILCAVWFVAAYFLSVKFCARAGCVRGHLVSDRKPQRKLAARALTGDELSRHHAHETQRLKRRNQIKPE